MSHKRFLVIVHNSLPVRERVEIAVITFGLAERDMDINTQLIAHRDTSTF